MEAVPKSQLTLSLFGTPLIKRDGVPLHFATRKATATLIYLAITQQPQSRESLMLLLWPEADAGRARASLRRALADIKKEAGADWLQIERDFVGLKEESNIMVDVWEFRRLLTAVPPHQQNAYSEAAALYKSDFLAGFTLRDSPDFDEWQFFEQENLRQGMMNVLDSLISSHQEAGELEPAIAYLRRRVTFDPLHEPAHAQLMQLFAENGQQTAALHQYEVCRRVLANELGLEPDAATTSLYHQIKSHRFHLPKIPPLNLPNQQHERSRHNLPNAASSFIGRQDELIQIAAMLDNPQLRLLTLAGLGGIGKTRLALEVAAGQVGRFAHGVWVIALDSVQTYQTIPTAVADTLDLTWQGNDDPLQQLIRYLQGKEMLLLFDNFEHSLHLASTLSEILQQVPTLKVMVTSREMLDLAEEWLFAVEGLPTPENSQQSYTNDPLLPPSPSRNYASVQLFIQRGLQASQNFSLANNQAEIAAICQLVDGMPLAIELAAAWVRMLSCQQIVVEIQRNLDFLTTTQRNAKDRHRSIRAVFETSWQMLSTSEQALLAQLSIFWSTFSTDAALTIANASLFSLYSLLNKSLLQTVANGRYKLHSLLRQFAQEKLAQMSPEVAKNVHERHSEYYNNLLQQQRGNLQGAQQTATLETISLDMENCYQAWLWAAENGRMTDLTQSFDTLYSYHAMRSLYLQGEQIFGQTITLLEPYLGVSDQETITLLARLTVFRGEYLYTVGKMSQAENALRQALSFTEQMSLESEHQLAVQTLGVITYLQGRYSEAKQLLHQALDLVTKLNTTDRQAYILMTLGAIEQALGNYKEAKKHHQTSLDMFHSLDYQWGIANSLRFLGITAHRQGHFAQARTYHQQSLDICRTINFETGIAMALNNLGLVAEATGELQNAHNLYRQALIPSKESHSRWSQATSLQNIGRVLITLHQPQEGQEQLHLALETAVNGEALPLMLEIILDMAHQLEATDQGKQAAAMATLVAQHPASNYEIQKKAQHMQKKLSSPSINLPLIEPTVEFLQKQIHQISNPSVS